MLFAKVLSVYMRHNVTLHTRGYSALGCCRDFQTSESVNIHINVGINYHKLFNNERIR